MHKTSLKCQFLTLLFALWVSQSVGALPPDEIERMREIVSRRRDWLGSPDQALNDQWSRDSNAAFEVCERALAEGAYDFLGTAFKRRDINLRGLVVDNLVKVPLEDRRRIILSALTDGDWPDPKKYQYMNGSISGLLESIQGNFCLRLSEAFGVKVGNKKRDQGITDPLWTREERLAIAAMLKEKAEQPQAKVSSSAPSTASDSPPAVNHVANAESPTPGLAHANSEPKETFSAKEQGHFVTICAILTVTLLSLLGIHMVRRK